MPATLRKAAKETVRMKVSLDFPKQNEIIHSPCYTLRIAAPENAQKVEVSIDQGPWQLCRPSVGYWWFDWSNFADGEHEAIAHIETREGRRFTTEPHEFFVDLHPKAVKN